MQTKDLKVMVLGPKSGKSQFIKSLTNTNHLFQKTLGCDVSTIDIFTNNDKRRINFWEIGSEVQGLKQDYCINSDFAIIFKKSNNNKHEEFENWLSNEIPRIYVSDYDITQNESIIQNIKNLISNSFL